MKNLTPVFIIVSVLSVFILFASNPHTNNLTTSANYQNKLTFERWLEEYARQYGSDQEKLFRFDKFLANLKIIEEQNEKYQKGESSYELGLNAFADMDNTQFIHKFVSSPLPSISSQCTAKLEILSKIPNQEDWSPRAVTQVKTQGTCNSAYAFSAAGAIEGLYRLTKGLIANMSAQQIVDCSQQYGNEGCVGGSVVNAFQYVIDNGITDDKTYPYVLHENECTYKKQSKIFSINKCAKVKQNSTQALKSAMVQQPVSVLISSSSVPFQLYKRGIFTGYCGQIPNHAMVLIGYGDFGEGKYWKLKNSWGLSWGQEGYMFLTRGEQEGQPGHCSILMESYVPLV